MAFVLCFPWSLTFLQRCGSKLQRLRRSRGGGSRVWLNLAAPRARFDLGPLGHGVLSYAFLLAAGFVLVVGGAQRFSWGALVGGWRVGAVAVAWAAGEGWFGAGGGAARVLVVPAGVAVQPPRSASASVRSKATWRPRASAGDTRRVSRFFVLIGLVGLMPVLGASAGGRWQLPQNGDEAILTGVAGAHGIPAGRYLWLGAPLAVPAQGWQVRPGFTVALTSSVLPDAGRQLYPSANRSSGAPATQLTAAVRFGRRDRLRHR